MFFKRLMCLAASCVPILCWGGPHKELDLRNQSDASGNYSVSICARPSPGPASLPGHAFLVYSFTPAGKERRVLSLGFTTDSAVKGVLSYSALLAQPAGFLGEENYAHINEQCLVLLVNEADFNRALSIAKPFHDLPAIENVTYSGIYALTANDCVTFAMQVTQVFAPKGIVVPPRQTLDLPLDYIRKLIDSN